MLAFTDTTDVNTAQLLADSGWPGWAALYYAAGWPHLPCALQHCLAWQDTAQLVIYEQVRMISLVGINAIVNCPFT